MPNRSKFVVFDGAFFVLFQIARKKGRIVADGESLLFIPGWNNLNCALLQLRPANGDRRER